MAVRLQLQDDTACCPRLAKIVDHVLILLLRCGQSSAVLSADCTICAVYSSRADLQSNLIDILIQSLLLYPTCRLARKLRTIKIRIGSNSACPLYQLPQCLTGTNA